MKLESYENMLDELYISLPKKVNFGERFVMPNVDAFIEGNKTILKNFSQIIQTIRREDVMLSKFLSKELAAPVKKEKDILIIQRKVNKKLLQSKVEIFIKDYVLCAECNKPDTKLITTQGIKTLVCEACGARRPIR